MSFKKLMSAVIAVAMLVSCMGITVFAEENELPECVVANLEELDNIPAVNLSGEEELLNLDFGRVFSATEAFDPSSDSEIYDYLADFVITFSHDVTAKLAGWYELAGENWVALCSEEPFEIEGGTVNKYGYTFKANTPVRIMKTAGIDARFTYRDVLNFVKEFKCGVELAPDTLDGVIIDLALCLYKTDVDLDDEGHKQFEELVEYKISSERFIYDNPLIDVPQDAEPEEIVNGVNNVEITSDEAFNTVVDLIAELPAEEKANVAATTLVNLYSYKMSDVETSTVASGYSLEGYNVSVTEPVSLFGLEMDMGNIYNVSVTDSANNPIDLTAVPVLVKLPAADDVAAVLYENNGVTTELDFVQNGGYIYFGMTEFGSVSVITKTDEISVQFTEVEEGLYDINLVASNGAVINRLLSADLTFKLTADNDMDYEIIPVAPVKVKAETDDRYLFNFDGVTTPDKSDVSIKIGQVKFTGYSEFKFVVDENANETNIVNATESDDSIVEHFYVNGGAAGEGNLVINDANNNGIIDSEVVVPTEKLTINVDFPNAVEKNVASYQKMTVTVAGDDIETLTYNLGEEMTTDGKYVIEIEDTLTLNNAYTVEVSGEGYRTARYTVTMTGEKNVNFWNNVKDDATEVETDKSSSAKNVTFLAGDIVKDSNINIYDLSAVVSYFGTINLKTAVDADKYIKYDLNRDGKIDSKDVAYVLVSWNK